MKLADLKKGKGLTDREKVAAWLTSIEEFDKLVIDEVMETCAKDKDAKEYFIGRFCEIERRAE